MYKMFSTCLIDIDHLIANVLSSINHKVVNLNSVMYYHQAFQVGKFLYDSKLFTQIQQQMYISYIQWITATKKA